MSKLLLTSLILLVSCNTTASNWFIAPDRNLSGWSDLPFCVLPKKVVNKYLGELDNVDFLEISANITIEHCGDTVNKNTKPYLVKALFINKFTGKYSVKRRKKSIWVNHNSLAPEDAKISKNAIIVFLTKLPEYVYVTAYADG